MMFVGVGKSLQSISSWFKAVECSAVVEAEEGCTSGDDTSMSLYKSA